MKTLYWNLDVTQHPGSGILVNLFIHRHQLHFMSTLDQIESLFTKAGDLAETKAELWKLKTVNKVSETVASIISKIAIVALLALAVIIISLGLAYWIGYMLKNVYYGFFIVGGFYVLLGILIHVFRRQIIKRPISNIIIDRLIK